MLFSIKVKPSGLPLQDPNVPKFHQLIMVVLCSYF